MTRRTTVWAAWVLVAALSGACSQGGDSRTPEAEDSVAEPSSTPTPQGTTSPAASPTPTGAAEPYTGWPDSIAALGHSGVTGEGSGDAPGEGSLENSWVTGTNPEVNSVYRRLIAHHPRIEGSRLNLGEALATIPDLEEQVGRLLAMNEPPELVVVQLVDNDMRCPATRQDFRQFRDELQFLLEQIADGAPASRIFVPSYFAEPGSYVRALTPAERRKVGGTGPCAIIDAQGRADPEELTRLERIIDEYGAALRSACEATDRCVHDGGAFERARLSREHIAGDLIHMSVAGNAVEAAVAWRAMRRGGLLPARATTSDAVGAQAGGHLPQGSFAVNGHDLYLECIGKPSEPTMILENGEALTHDTMAPIAEAYADRLRVCSYDRANVGQSEAAPTPRTGRDVAADLHELLQVAEVPGPYLLVGHSAGGLLVQAFAITYPEDVAGVVALNPVSPWQQWSTVGFRDMTPRERRDELAYYTGANGESLQYRATSQEIAAKRIPLDVPFHVLISTTAQCDDPDDICARTYPAYERIMKQLSERWPRGRFSQVEAPHEIHLADMSAVRKVIDDVLSRS